MKYNYYVVKLKAKSNLQINLVFDCSFFVQNKTQQGLVGLMNLGNTVSPHFKRTPLAKTLLDTLLCVCGILLTLLVFYCFQCFMNSILQCLSNTQELRDYCLMNFHRTDLNNNSTASTALMEGKCSVNLKLSPIFKSAQNSQSGAK